MPVKKTKPKVIKSKAKPQVETKHCGFGKTFCGDFMHKIVGTLFIVLLVYLIVFFGTLIRNNIEKFDHIGLADKSERTITIDAEGEVTATPDVANATMGVSSEGETVAEAQEKNTAVMNKLITSLKALGIVKEDIKTANYNVYPKYRYTEEEGQITDGYQVSQNVTIKIKDLDKSNQVLALAGELEVNNVSGLNFTLDDREVYVEKARAAALKKVKQKAQALAQNLGVRIVSIVAYSEFESGSVTPFPLRSFAELDGFGGGAPDIEEGSTDVSLSVSVTFEIR